MLFFLRLSSNYHHIGLKHPSLVLRQISFDMIILENQDERSPLKTEGDIDIATPSADLRLATATPPYVPTLPPNLVVPSYQAVPHSHHVTVRRQQLTIRRLLVAFAIACLILLLCGASMYGFYKAAISSDNYRCPSANPFLCS